VSHVQPSITSSSIDVYQHLLGLCNELVRKNKIIKLDKLYNIARRELPVDASVILREIKRLEDDMVIKADSRLMRAELLQNETRRELYFIIMRNPGISFNQIRSQMGKGTKMLLWHVEVLSDFGCIRSCSFDSNARAFFTRHVSEQEWTLDGLLMFQLYQNGTTKQILDMLSDGNSHVVKSIEGMLGISRQLVEYHLKKLQDNAIVDSIDEIVRKYFMVDLKRRLYLKCKAYFTQQPNA
jgi:predicted transcriptional regulator